MLHAVEKTFLVSATHATGCTCKSRGMLPGGDQTVAATANDESLQVRVRESHPPKEGQLGTLRLKGAKTGFLLNP